MRTNEKGKAYTHKHFELLILKMFESDVQAYIDEIDKCEKMCVHYIAILLNEGVTIMNNKKCST